MEGAIAQFEETRQKRMLAQEQLVKVHTRINASTLKLKRLEAEIEELDTVDGAVPVMRQIGRVFVEIPAKDMLKVLKETFRTTEDEIPKLRVIAQNFKVLVESTAKLCEEAESALAKEAAKMR